MIIKISLFGICAIFFLAEAYHPNDGHVPIHHVWVQNALDLITQPDYCSRFMYSVQSKFECQKFHKNFRRNNAITKSSIRAYVAEHPGKSVRAYLPDGPLAHGPFGYKFDGFVVIDPFPQLDFGHWVVIFGKTDSGCRSTSYEGQLEIEGSSTCLVHLTKCNRNATDFLPSIFIDQFNNTQTEHPCAATSIAPPQGNGAKRWSGHLHCQNVTGLAPCPTPVHRRIKTTIDLDDNETLIWNQLKLITGGGGSEESSIETKFAVIIRGGPATPIGGKFYDQATVEDRLFDLRQNLIENYQFGLDKTRTFFGNGKIHHSTGTDLRYTYPAKKRYIKQMLMEICPTIAGTLVLFLIGGAKDDGSLLLYDWNHDGVAQEDEVYSPEDLFVDLAYCRIKRIHIITDYSYSGRLIDRFANKTRSGFSLAPRVTIIGNGYSPSLKKHQICRAWSERYMTGQCFEKNADYSGRLMEGIDKSFTKIDIASFANKASDIKWTLAGQPCFTDD